MQVGGPWEPGKEEPLSGGMGKVLGNNNMVGHNVNWEKQKQKLSNFIRGVVVVGKEGAARWQVKGKVMATRETRGRVANPVEEKNNANQWDSKGRMPCARVHAARQGTYQAWGKVKVQGKA